MLIAVNIIMLLFFVPVNHHGPKPCALTEDVRFNLTNATPRPVTVFTHEHEGHADAGWTQNFSCCDGSLRKKFDLGCNVTGSGGQHWNCSFSKKDTPAIPTWIRTHCSDFKLLQPPNNVSVLQFVPTKLCNITETTPVTCMNRTNISDSDMGLFGPTFWMYFTVNCLSSFIAHPVWSQVNAIAYTMLGDERNTWGRHRLWGTFFVFT